MSQEYVKSCLYCKKEIRMSERLGKWFPNDIDGGFHYCEAKKEKQKQEPPKQQLKNLLEAQLLLEGLDARVKKLERIVVDPRPEARRK